MKFNTAALKLARLFFLVLIKKLDSDHERIAKRKNQVIKTAVLIDIACLDVEERNNGRLVRLPGKNKPYKDKGDEERSLKK
jgi:hypothetical protein